MRLESVLRYDTLWRCTMLLVCRMTAPFRLRTLLLVCRSPWALRCRTAPLLEPQRSGPRGMRLLLVADLSHGMQLGTTGEHLDPQVTFSSERALLTQHCENVADCANVAAYQQLSLASGCGVFPCSTCPVTSASWLSLKFSLLLQRCSVDAEDVFHLCLDVVCLRELCLHRSCAVV